MIQQIHPYGEDMDYINTVTNRDELFKPSSIGCLYDPTNPSNGGLYHITITTVINHDELFKSAIREVSHH